MNKQIDVACAAVYMLLLNSATKHLSYLEKSSLFKEEIMIIERLTDALLKMVEGGHSFTRSSAEELNRFRRLQSFCRFLDDNYTGANLVSIENVNKIAENFFKGSRYEDYLIDNIDLNILQIPIQYN